MKKIWLIVLMLVSFPTYGMLKTGINTMLSLMNKPKELSPVEQVAHTLGIEQKMMNDLVGSMKEDEEKTILNLTNMALTRIQAEEPDEEWNDLTWVYQRVEQLTSIENPTHGDLEVRAAAQDTIKRFQDRLHNPLYREIVLLKENPERGLGVGAVTCGAGTYFCGGPLLNICCFPFGTLIGKLGLIPVVAGLYCVIDSCDKSREISGKIASSRIKIDKLAAIFKEKEE